MNWLVTFLDQDVKANGNQMHSEHKESPELSPSAIEFLQSYWGNDNSNELQKIVEQSQRAINIENLFRELDNYAAKCFNTEPSLSLKLRENTIAISQSKDTVYMNTVMSTAFWSYIATQIYHSYVLDSIAEREV